MEHETLKFFRRRVESIFLLLLGTLGIWTFSVDTAFAATWDVSITSTGYVPQIVYIQSGDTVRWTNNDHTTPTRGVNSDPHNTHSDYPALDFDDIDQDDSVQLTFPEACVQHGYHDHEKDEDVGSIVVGGSCGRREPDNPVFWGVTVTKLSPTSALIEWSTERGSYTQLAYGTQSGSYDISSSMDGTLTKFHRAEITDLTASTTYYYHAVGGVAMDQKIASGEYRFTTPAPRVELPSVPAASTTATTNVVAPPPAVIPPPSTTTPAMDMMNMPDMPGMTHHHTGMGVSAYAIRTVHSLKFSTDLRFGDSDEAVRTLQDWLIARKLLAEGLHTGYFGPLTRHGVIKYQKNMGLPETGFFGPLTRQMIEDMGE